MLQNAVIQGFKCLRDVNVNLGPFNVLIGPNDSGKSSFLQSLSWLGNQIDYPESFKIRLDTEQKALLMVQKHGAPTAFSLGPAQAPSDHFTRPTGDWMPPFLTSQPILLDPVEITKTAERGLGALGPLVASRGRGASAHLARLALSDRERYEAIQAALRGVTGGRIKHAVVNEEGNGYSLAFRLYDGKVVQAREISQGLLMYFAFLALIHRDDAPSTLLIEEPENGLHPLRLHELVGLLRSLTERGIQIIMTTHSPDLLSACKPEEVLVFRRPNPDSGTEIHRLPADFERIAMREPIGQVWASRGEEGLLDMLPKVEPAVRADPQ